MPVPCDVNPPPPANSKQPGVNPSLLYNGSRFQGHQKSKGNSYEVEVVLQSKFASFCQYSKTFNADCFDYDEIKSTDFVFMRWKEHFLVPDHTIRDISGASFAGFYYICFQKSRATIEGYYYHRSSEISSHGIVSPEYAIFQPSTCSKLTPNAFGQCLTTDPCGVPLKTVNMSERRPMASTTHCFRLLR
ncbi:unnamed protein product [Nesidiocoris tenuis]|uniref:Uncharacterized protein n=1 Tax=Nesidiocoris tenuis TaxID=355587 RepID=A0A6H5G1Q4_9HEMI|nr:unnamed protein product [Nesidiocoris tenuis]